MADITKILNLRENAKTSYGKTYSNKDQLYNFVSVALKLSFLFVVLSPFLNKLFMGFMDKARTSGAELTAKQIEDMEKGKAVLELTSANMIPLMAIGLVSVALCVLGAMWMRKLKKDFGFIQEANYCQL